MAKRNLLPKRRSDRVIFFAIAALMVLVFGLLMYLSKAWEYSAWVMFAQLTVLVGGLVSWWIIAVSASGPPESSEDYTATLVDIEEIGKKLSNLADFLTRERRRVEESEATLSRLRNEKTELEPVVTAQRETVDAILTAHAKATASRAWKERALAFLIGVVTSLIATLLFEVFRSPQK